MTSKWDELADKAAKLAEGASEKLQDSEQLGELKQLATDLGEEAAVFVRKYPLQSVLGAAVVGFLLGSGLGRRK